MPDQQPVTGTHCKSGGYWLPNAAAGDASVFVQGFQSVAELCSNLTQTLKIERLCSADWPRLIM